MEESWHSYPKVYALGHRAISDLLLDDVVVEEKVDGSQFSAGRFNGELRMRSKGKKFTEETAEEMFHKAVKTAKQLDLTDGWTYRFEYLQKPKHNALAYDRIPRKHLILFDINTGHEEYMPHTEKLQEAQRLGLEVVPCIYKGTEFDLKALDHLLSSISVLGGQKIEGVVIKNYHRFGPDKKALMGKYVSEWFKEVNQKNWKQKNPMNKDILQKIIEAHKTEARWDKAVQHLKEQGQLQDDPKDIGDLIKEVHADIEEECKEDIKESLYKWAWPHIRRGVTSRLPEWYKKKLAERCL